jgi:hypothetical protein
VRPAKIAMADARDAQRLGTLTVTDRKAVAAGLRAILGAVIETPESECTAPLAESAAIVRRQLTGVSVEERRSL